MQRLSDPQYIGKNLSLLLNSFLLLKNKWNWQSSTSLMKKKTCLEFGRLYKLKNHNISNLNTMINCETSPPSTDSLLVSKVSRVMVLSILIF